MKKHIYIILITANCILQLTMIADLAVNQAFAQTFNKTNKKIIPSMGNKCIQLETEESNVYSYFQCLREGEKNKLQLVHIIINKITALTKVKRQSVIENSGSSIYLQTTGLISFHIASSVSSNCHILIAQYLKQGKPYSAAYFFTLTSLDIKKLDKTLKLVLVDQDKHLVIFWRDNQLQFVIVGSQLTHYQVKLSQNGVGYSLTKSYLMIQDSFSSSLAGVGLLSITKTDKPLILVITSKGDILIFGIVDLKMSSESFRFFNICEIDKQDEEGLVLLQIEESLIKKHYDCIQTHFLTFSTKYTLMVLACQKRYKKEEEKQKRKLVLEFYLLSYSDSSIHYENVLKISTSVDTLKTFIQFPFHNLIKGHFLYLCNGELHAINLTEPLSNPQKKWEKIQHMVLFQTSMQSVKFIIYRQTFLQILLGNGQQYQFKRFNFFSQQEFMRKKMLVTFQIIPTFLQAEQKQKIKLKQKQDQIVNATYNIDINVECNEQRLQCLKKLLNSYLTKMNLKTAQLHKLELKCENNIKQFKGKWEKQQQIINDLKNRITKNSKELQILIQDKFQSENCSLANELRLISGLLEYRKEKQVQFQLKLYHTYEQKIAQQLKKAQLLIAKYEHTFGQIESRYE